MRIAAILLPLAFASCDGTKHIVEKAFTAVKEKVAETTSDDDSPRVAPDLRQLVDQTPEGAVFRKDLPFPARLEVTVSRSNQMSGRLFQSSAIEKRSEVLNGTHTLVAKLERSGDQVRHYPGKSTFSVPSPKDPAVAQTTTNPLDQSPSSKPVGFHKTGNTWTSDERDGFRAAALSKQLAPVFDQLLIDNALAPRPLWFGKRRINVGEKIHITGESLSMIVAGNAKGSLDLTLESFKAVKGHPCGVFSVKGEFSRKQFPDFDGNLIDEETAIQSGKLWLSLIYPIILKEDLDTIRSFKTGGQGNLVGRGQGTFKITTEREWKAL